METELKTETEETDRLAALEKRVEELSAAEKKRREEPILSEELKQKVIAEYLKSLGENSPKVKLSGDSGAAPATPKNKPKSFGEAAEYAFYKLGAKS